MLRSLSPLFALPLFFAAAPAAALSIDFDSFGHGDIVANPLADHGGYTLVVENLHRSFDIGVAFDTGVSRSSDSDLEMGNAWSGGNLAPSTELGRILILQENDDCGALSCSDPDDEGKRPAGKFTFLFDQTFQLFSFDLVDVEDASMEMGRITFFERTPGGVDIVTASFGFDEFLGLGQGVAYGDNTANRIDLGEVGDFNAVQIELGGSGGIDNLNATVVPEPGTATLLGLGLVALARFGRRRA